VQFLNQYAQSGQKGQIPLYTAFTIDSITLPLQKDLALGVPGAQQESGLASSERLLEQLEDAIAEAEGES
jgi:hypothetical protein